MAFDENPYFTQRRRGRGVSGVTNLSHRYRRLRNLYLRTGGVLAFPLIAAVASGFFREELEDQPSNVKALSGALSFLSVGLALGVVYLVGILIQGIAAWPVSAFSTIIVYIASVGIEVAVAHRLLRRGE